MLLASACLLAVVSALSSPQQQPSRKAEILVVESKDLTSRDITLKFELQKTTWNTSTDKVYIWGKVSNAEKKFYTSVQGSFTAYDKDGKFLGRNSFAVIPSDMGPGQVGYLNEVFVETEGRKPTKIEYKVTGER